MLRSLAGEFATAAILVALFAALMLLGGLALWAFHAADQRQTRGEVEQRMRQVCAWIAAYRQETGGYPDGLWQVRERFAIPERDWFPAISNPRYFERTAVNASFSYARPATAGALMLVDRCELIDGDETWVADGEGRLERRALGRVQPADAPR